MDSLDQGLKCIVCILYSLKDKDHTAATSIQEGVDGAKTAVAVVDGQSLCAEHLHERMASGSMEQYMADVEKSVSGRR